VSSFQKDIPAILRSAPFDKDEIGQALTIELFRMLTSVHPQYKVDNTLVERALLALLTECHVSATDVLAVFMESEHTIGTKVHILSLMSEAAFRLANLSNSSAPSECIGFVS
jgi:hypothetical protein